MGISFEEWPNLANRPELILPFAEFSEAGPHLFHLDVDLGS
jgi:hypothetical protein